jgi:cytochrome c5
MKWMAISGLLIFSGLLSAGSTDTRSTRDDPAAREAFQAGYTVLMHPRCMNCHPKGDAPLQGDDSHVHIQNVKRGADGHGKYGMKCGACHQDTNLAGANMPPGAAEWHLPSPNMRLVFEGRSAGQLCRQLKDPQRNGGKTIQGVIDHLGTPLVKWGWSPGDGRSTPPLSYEEFVQKMQTWAAKGAACP